MRLIDADEFASEEPKLWDWSSVDGISSTAVLKQCIWDVQCAPEVKAIPIEWIEKQIELYYEDGYNSYGKALNIMLVDWKTEKEAEHGKEEN